MNDALANCILGSLGILIPISIVFWIGFNNIDPEFWKSRTDRLKHREQERTERLHAKFTYRAAKKSIPYQWNPNKVRDNDGDDE